MKTTSRSTILALALLAGTALPAAAAPQGPPSILMGTEQAYVMAPLTAYASGGIGGLTIRNGLPGNIEWFLQNTTLGLSPAFSMGTNLGAKLMFMGGGPGLSGAVFGGLRPSLAAGTFGLGLDAGLAFSQSLVFGNISIDPNVSVNNLTSGAATNLNLNVALIAPLSGGWLLVAQDVPSYALTGGAFTNQLSIGGRFVPAPNTALDITLAQVTTAGATSFNAGVLGVNGWVGW
ncbi:MAG: hypothetical protein JWM80_2332 [Cyanobacteria bacterium RYN_339]|nr:hypothetical protein [Cyanobacteria bacterium RYN_339]